MPYALSFLGSEAAASEGVPWYPPARTGPGAGRGRSGMTESDEGELLERARRGDRAAFGALVRVHQRRVYACALQMLADAGEAEDAAQETFLRAWRAIDRFEGGSLLSTWLYRICVNVCLNIIRRRRRISADLADPRVPEPAADPTQGKTDPGLGVESLQLYRRLARALDGLSETLRTTVVLVLVQGLAHKEAAEVLGCPEGTVAWRIHEARRRLRETLEPAERAADAAEPSATATDAAIVAGLRRSS
jgi:RNA polymerase sigma-70 factor, ECF subfamily